MSDSTLSQQLSELRRTRYINVPRLRYVMQTFLPSTKHSLENRIEARTRVLDWARNKWPGLIPVGAYEGQAFEYDQAGLRIAATCNVDGTIWSFRSEHLSHESRTWVTEALVADLGPTDAIGVRNSCSTISGEDVPATSPRFLRDFIAHHTLIDAGVPATATSHFVTDTDTLKSLLDLLLSVERILPVIVLTPLPDTTTYAIDPAKLARDTQGLAHVYCLPAALTFELSDLVGKPLSVFHGAVRTYYPGFSLRSNPWQHHLVFPQRIVEWVDEQGASIGANAFEQFLSRQLHFFSVGTPSKIEQLPSYFSIRRALLDKPNKTTAEEIQALHLELEEAHNKEQSWQTQALESDGEARAYEEENRSLKAQNITLAYELQNLRKAKGVTAIPTPSNYDEIQNWINAYFSDRLVLHSRAIRGLKDAVFEDISLVCNSLKLLADTYWELKANHDQSQHQARAQAWDDGLQSLGLEYNSHSLTDSRLGEFRSTYTIDYRIGQKSRQILGPHLKYGSTKDDRFCMRIYFLWDDERQLVLIGSLPAHLDTRAS